MIGGRASNRRGGARLAERPARSAAALVVVALGALGFVGCGLAAGLSEKSDGFGAEAAEAAAANTEAAAMVPAGAPAAADGGARRAVLARGSAAVRGVPPLGRNAMAALYGAYSLPSPATTAAGEPGDPSAEVWYTAEPVALGASWALVACRGLPSGWLAYESRPKGDDPPAWALKAAEYWLFVRFPAGYAAPCAFAAALADRFDWFRRYGGSAAELAFPALLDLAP